MTIDEIQAAFRFDMDMILFDPFTGESESEEWYLERNKRNGNEMNIVCYLAKKEAIDLLEELKTYKELDLEIPQHFTKEQSAWIKKYCIERNKEFYNNAIDDLIFIINEHKTKGYVTGITHNSFEFGACQMADDIVKIAEQLKAGVKE